MYTWTVKWLSGVHWQELYTTQQYNNVHCITRLCPYNFLPSLFAGFFEAVCQIHSVEQKNDSEEQATENVEQSGRGI